MRTRLVLVALLVASVMAACGKGDAPPAASGDPTTTTTEAPTTTTVAEEGSGDGAATGETTELSFTATEYAYAAEGDAGAAPIPAGEVTINLANAGAEEHQISIARLREGKTLDDLAAIGEDPAQLSAVLETFGGPNAAAPGASVSTTQFLPAGEFLFLCFIPAPDGQPHAVKGMLMPVTVEGDAEPPSEDGADPFVLSDYSFGLGTAEEPAEVSEGEWGFVNDGTQAHEAAIYTVAEGASNEDVAAYFADPAPAGPPPIVPAGGIGPMEPGGPMVRTEVAPGDYVFICFLPDPADGAPHFVKGMLEFATVT